MPSKKTGPRVKSQGLHFISPSASEVLVALLEVHKENAPATFAKVAAACTHDSRNVQFHLESLEDRGFVRIVPGTPRIIEPTGAP